MGKTQTLWPGDVTSIPDRGQYLARGIDSMSVPHVQASFLDDKYCWRCKALKPRSDFYTYNSRDGLDYWCKPCRSVYSGDWQKRNPEKRRRRIYHRMLRMLYGMTPEQHAAMVAAQAGLCAICGEPPTNKIGLCVDHDHATGQVRALLCSHCNSMIGMAKEDPSRLRAAVAYLEHWRPRLL